MKITRREKRRHAVGREKKFLSPVACRLFSRGVIFTRARVSLALLSLRKNGGLTTRSLVACLGVVSFGEEKLRDGGGGEPGWITDSVLLSRTPTMLQWNLDLTNCQGTGET